ncbi:MAG: response regulator transcription factor [Bacteroidota bacterium]
MSEQLRQLYNDPEINNDPVLVGLIDEAASRTDWMLHICRDITSRCTDFVSDTCQHFFGISPTLFAAGGAKAMYEITHVDSRPAAMTRQIEYLKQSKSPDFDRMKLVIQHFPVWMKTTEAFELFHIRGVVLTYHLSGDLQFGLALTHRHSDELATPCEEWLTAIKQRHNAIHQQKHFKPSAFPLHPVYGDIPPQTVTPREAEVLQLIASGMATQEVANKLFISHHTVETYRKKLLEKFEAKNTAELIKKASKVFWLE